MKWENHQQQSTRNPLATTANNNVTRNSVDNIVQAPHQNLIHGLRSQLSVLKHEFMRLTSKSDNIDAIVKSQKILDKQYLENKSFHDKQKTASLQVQRKKSTNDKQYQPSQVHPRRHSVIDGETSKPHYHIQNQLSSKQFISNKSLQSNNKHSIGKLMTPSEIYELNFQSKYTKNMNEINKKINLKADSNKDTNTKESAVVINQSPIILNNKQLQTNPKKTEQIAKPICYNISPLQIQSTNKLKQQNISNIATIKILQQKCRQLESQLSTQLVQNTTNISKINTLEQEVVSFHQNNQKQKQQINTLQEQINQEINKNSITKQYIQQLKNKEISYEQNKIQSRNQIKQLRQKLYQYESNNNILNVQQQKLVIQRQSLSQSYSSNNMKLRQAELIIVELQEKVQNKQKEYEKVALLLKQHQQRENDVRNMKHQISKGISQYQAKVSKLQMQLEEDRKIISLLQNTNIQKNTNQQPNPNPSPKQQILFEKQKIIHNMLRDMKLLQKQVHDLGKLKKQYQEIIGTNNQIISRKCVNKLNDKYKKIQNQYEDYS